MTTRQELLDQWRSCLVAAEEACDDPATDSWSARVRLKLYRFLLTMYGKTAWPGPKDDVDNEAGRALTNQLVVAEPEEALAGKEPRTRAEILKGLASLKGLSDELAPAGPLAEGLHPHSPVVVTAFKKHYLAERTRWRLRQAGFQPTIVPNGDLTQISVPACQSSAAIAHLKNSPMAKPRSATPKITSTAGKRSNGALILAIVFALLGLFALVSALVERFPPYAESTGATLQSMLVVVVCTESVAALLFWNWWTSQPFASKPHK